MTSKAAEKIADALTKLMEGFVELQQQAQEEARPAAASDSDESTGDTDDLETEVAVEEAVSLEMKSAVETFLDAEDFAVEEFAALISHLTEALEILEPEVFSSEEEVEDEYEYDSSDEDDFDLDEEEEDEEDEDKER